MGKVKYIIFLLKMVFHDFKPGKGLEFTAHLGIIQPRTLWLWHFLNITRLVEASGSSTSEGRGSKLRRYILFSFPLKHPTNWYRAVSLTSFHLMMFFGGTHLNKMIFEKGRRTCVDNFSKRCQDSSYTTFYKTYTYKSNYVYTHS